MEHGQATIEAALTLPVVLIGLLLIVEVGLVVRDALALVQAAREGARAVAVLGTDDAAASAVRRSAGPLDADRIEIDISPPFSERERGGAITVTLRYEARLRIPIVSRIASMELPLRSSATMRSERSAPTPTPAPPP
ncbi:MAG: TadE family protein [Actinomycetota bacterium]